MIVADYMRLRGGYTGLSALAQIGWAGRDMIEAEESRRVAAQLFERLPKTDAEEATFVRQGYELASRMSWEVVVRNYLLPALEAAGKPRK